MGETESETAMKQPPSTRKVILNRIGVIISMVGTAVGFGNMYQFPTEVAERGGLAFVLLYVICAFVMCIPFAQLEISMGHFSRGSPVDAGNMTGNIRHGYLGVSLVAILGVLAFYSTLEATSVRYMVDSFSEPWFLSPEDYQSNILTCSALTEIQCTGSPEICFTVLDDMGENFLQCEAIAPLDYSINNQMSNVPYDSDGVVDVDWQLFGLLGFVWLFVLLLGGVGQKLIPFVMNGISVPLVILLFVMLGISVSLPNAGAGIQYYIGRFDASQLADLDIIKASLVQAIFSCSLGSFVIPMLSSLNDMQAPLGRTAYYVVIGDTMVGLISGFIVFGMVGYLAAESGVSVEEFMTKFEGNQEGLVYSVYSLGISTYFYGRGAEWVNFFFFLLYSLMGFTSILCITVSVCQAIYNTVLFKHHFGHGRMQELVIITVMCVTTYVFGIFNCSDFAMPILIAYITSFVTEILMPGILMLQGYWFCYQSDQMSDEVIGPFAHSLTKFMTIFNIVFVGIQGVWFGDATLEGIMWIVLAFGLPVVTALLLPFVYDRFNHKGYAFNLKYSFNGWPSMVFMRMREATGSEKLCDNGMMFSFAGAVLKIVAFPVVAAYTTEYLLRVFFISGLYSAMPPVHENAADWVRVAGSSFVLFTIFFITAFIVLPESTLSWVTHVGAQHTKGLFSKYKEYGFGINATSNVAIGKKEDDSSDSSSSSSSISLEALEGSKTLTA